MEKLLQELKNEKHKNAERIKELQGQIATLKNLLRHYVAQIDSLSKENIGLKTENQEIKDDTEELNTSKIKPRTHSRVPVIAFRFDSEQADRLNDLREGIGKYLGYFDSMQEASNCFDIPKSDIIAVANTWSPYQNYNKAMNLRFGDKGNGITNVRFSSNYKGKKNRWYAEEGNYGRRYYGLEPNKVVFFREDEIPQFILDKEDSYLPPCVKKHFKKSK